jgi:signal transduction histidine kinase/HAMP domain-containing protein
MRAGLTRRFAVAATLGLLVIGLSVAGLVVALRAIDEAEAASHRADRASIQVAVAVRLVVDLETGSRGLALTGDEAFLAPWRAAREALPGVRARLRREVEGGEARRALEGFERRLDEYEQAWTVPLVDLLRADRQAGLERIASGGGKARVDEIRSSAEDLSALLLRRADERDEATERAIAVAVAVALAGAVASGALLVLAVLALRRRVTRPLEDVARAAERIAAGDADARAATDGKDEIGALQRAFNTMADTLQERQAALLAARHAAEQQAAVNAAVLETSPDALGLFDEEGRAILVNRTLERFVSEITGEPARIGERMPTAADIGRAIERHVVDPEAYRRDLAGVLAAPGRPHRHTYQVARDDRTFLRLTAPVRAADGSTIGLLVVTRDITAERSAERAKDDLMAAVSHELRTPLASILGFAELLETRELDSAVQRRYAGTIHREARRLTALVDDLIDLRLVEQGRLALAPEPVDVAELLREQVELFARRSERHSFAVDAPDEPLVVTVDRLRLGQILGNLLSNAVKYSPDGGAIRASAEDRATHVRIAVADEGLGIPAADQARLFQRFFRGDRPAIRHIGGSGIGLALSRHLAEALGGAIGFTSIEGQGSTFWVDLPLVEASRTAGAGTGASAR